MSGNGDCISREAALQFVFDACSECMETCEEFDGIYADCHQCMLESVKLKLRDLPAADVRPNVRGRWENNHCSACGMMPMGDELWEDCDFDQPRFEWFMNYCPNCGAEMEAGE